MILEHNWRQGIDDGMILLLKLSFYVSSAYGVDAARLKVTSNCEIGSACIPCTELIALRNIRIQMCARMGVPQGSASLDQSFRSKLNSGSYFRMPFFAT